MTGLFRELERLGCKISGSTHAGEKFSVQVGAVWAHIYCHVESEPSQHSGRSTKPRLESLRFAITDYDAERGKPKIAWTESESKLETQVQDIVRGLLLQGERSHALSSYDWTIRQIAARQREAQLAAERAEAERVARERAAKEARIRTLTDGANALEAAARIRKYIAAVREKYEAHTPEEIDRWARWASSVADEIDPLTSDRYQRDLEGF